ncbi:MAG: hypothetical protein ACXQTW_03350, partial [Candidatus Methanospirareceae archaeon]
LWLAEEREISSYSRVALAIALDYGAVLPISEEEVRREMGANGINYPLIFERKDQYPKGTKYGEIGIPKYYDLNWMDIFSNKRIIWALCSGFLCS